MEKKKYIFVTGGVLSSLGKGLTSASIGALLESRGVSVTIQKLDPYINVDPGTMNPYQHGEVFVTDDGTETDLDLGHYERFTRANLKEDNNYTSGKIYYNVINKERKGKYLGSTVQVIPHITDEIKRVIYKVSKDVKVVIVEIGGTVGDIESLPFLEAIRQFKTDIGKNNVIYIHLTFVPYINTAGEVKTKPTQHSVKELRSIGIQPDILICRTNNVFNKKIKSKIAMFCNLSEDAVITAKDVESIYDVPLIFNEEGLDNKIISLLKISAKMPLLNDWEKLCNNLKNIKKSVDIAIVGKYVNLTESYKSLNEALTHGGLYNNCKINFNFVDSEKINEKNCKLLLKDSKGILVPGGFGIRGINGKMCATSFARKNLIPFFGICLGMHIAVIEFVRNVIGIKSANSTEFNPNSKNPVIYFMDKWFEARSGTVQTRNYDSNKGGSMRLGSYACKIRKGSLAYTAYCENIIFERHRHRYEFNNKYKEIIEKFGMKVSGIYPDGNLIEIIEITDHPWFLGCQFHPEFKSKPMKPHPLFRSFIKASLEKGL